MNDATIDRATAFADDADASPALVTLAKQIREARDRSLAARARFDEARKAAAEAMEAGRAAAIEAQALLSAFEKVEAALADADAVALEWGREHEQAEAHDAPGEPLPG